MYRERHGCNSMPPLRMPFTTKLIRYCSKSKFFTKKFVHNIQKCVDNEQKGKVVKESDT